MKIYDQSMSLKKKKKKLKSGLARVSLPPKLWGKPSLSIVRNKRERETH